MFVGGEVHDVRAERFDTTKRPGGGSGSVVHGALRLLTVELENKRGEVESGRKRDR